MTKDDILNILSYSKDTGTFAWITGCYRNLTGRVAGTVMNSGYVRIVINKKRWPAHRLVWFIETGVVCKQLDHINGNRSDNRISNLREATTRQNQHNRHTHRAGRLVGTHFNKWHKKWSANIFYKGSSHHLGYFKTEQEAHERYLQELKLMGEEHVDTIIKT